MTHQQAGRIKYPNGNRQEALYRGEWLNRNYHNGYWVMPRGYGFRLSDTLDACLNEIDRVQDRLLAEAGAWRAGNGAANND